jgi:hypothetical protein
MKGLAKLYKVRGQSFGVCAVYCGDNVQWTKMIEDVPQNWSTTLRTIFEDQWSGNLEEDINTAFSMFDGNIEYCNIHLRLQSPVQSVIESTATPFGKLNCPFPKPRDPHAVIKLPLLSNFCMR